MLFTLHGELFSLLVSLQVATDQPDVCVNREGVPTMDEMRPPQDTQHWQLLLKLFQVILWVLYITRGNLE